MENLNYCYKYPHPSVTTDCVIFGFDGIELNILLIERGQDPYKGKWALPGGFLEMNETAEEGALRELKEETNMDNICVEQVGAFTEVNRDPRERVVTIAFYALVRPSMHKVTGGDDAARARWYKIKDMPALAFDHAHIIRSALKRLKEKIHLEPVGLHLLDETFSVSELQRLYESIVGEKIDRRKLYRKLMSLGIMAPAGESNAGTGHRRPALFTFNEKRYLELKRMGILLDF